MMKNLVIFGFIIAGIMLWFDNEKLKSVNIDLKNKLNHSEKTVGNLKETQIYFNWTWMRQGNIIENEVKMKYQPENKKHFEQVNEQLMFAKLRSDNLFPIK